MRNIIGRLLVAGILLTGCGGTVVAEEAENLASRKDELPSCRFAPCSPGWVCQGTTCVKGCDGSFNSCPEGTVCCGGSSTTVGQCLSGCSAI
jgi:hypothetical protein